MTRGRLLSVKLRRFRDPENPDRYIVRMPDGFLLGVVMRDVPPNNSHMALWTIEGRTGHFDTLRSAMEFLERSA